MDGCRQGSKTQILLFSTILIMNASFHRQTVAPDFYLDPIKDAPKQRLFNFILFIAVLPLIMLYSNKKRETTDSNLKVFKEKRYCCLDCEQVRIIN